MAGNVLAAVEAVLEADATLMAILTGSVYTSRSLGTRFINETDTATAYETLAGSGGVKQLKPCCVITPSSGPTPIGAAGCDRREWLRIGCYERTGYANTEAALDRIHALLHDTYISLDDGRTLHIEHVDTPWRAAEDDTVMTGTGSKASYEAARYAVVTSW